MTISRALPRHHLVLLSQLLRLLELFDAVARFCRRQELAARERTPLKLFEHTEQVPVSRAQGTRHNVSARRWHTLAAYAPTSVWLILLSRSASGYPRPDASRPRRKAWRGTFQHARAASPVPSASQRR